MKRHVPLTPMAGFVRLMVNPNSAPYTVEIISAYGTELTLTIGWKNEQRF